MIVILQTYQENSKDALYKGSIFLLKKSYFIIFCILQLYMGIENKLINFRNIFYDEFSAIRLMDFYEKHKLKVLYSYDFVDQTLNAKWFFELLFSYSINKNYIFFNKTKKYILNIVNLEKIIFIKLKNSNLFLNALLEIYEMKLVKIIRFVFDHRFYKFVSINQVELKYFLKSTFDYSFQVIDFLFNKALTNINNERINKSLKRKISFQKNTFLSYGKYTCIFQKTNIVFRNSLFYLKGIGVINRFFLKHVPFYDTQNKKTSLYLKFQ